VPPDLAEKKPQKKKTGTQIRKSQMRERGVRISKSRARGARGKKKKNKRKTSKRKTAENKRGRNVFRNRKMRREKRKQRSVPGEPKWMLTAQKRDSEGWELKIGRRGERGRPSGEWSKTKQSTAPAAIGKRGGTF